MRGAHSGSAWRACRAILPDCVPRRVTRHKGRAFRANREVRICREVGNIELCSALSGGRARGVVDVFGLRYVVGATSLFRLKCRIVDAMAKPWRRSLRRDACRPALGSRGPVLFFGAFRSMWRDVVLTRPSAHSAGRVNSPSMIATGLPFSAPSLVASPIAFRLHCGRKFQRGNSLSTRRCRGRHPVWLAPAVGGS